MKITLLATLPILLVAFALPSYADEDDSLTEKAVKVKVLKDADDSAASDAVKLKATSNVVKDEDDSTVKKAVKLKAIKEVGE